MGGGKLLPLIVGAILVSHTSGLELSPLCAICKCPQETPNTSTVDINCLNVKAGDLVYKNSSWFDSQNKSFPIIGVNLQNNGLTELTVPFVKSDLMALDLSNNSIKNISDGVFANLQKMELLVLSNNEIEYLSPDAFKGVYLNGYYYPLASLKELVLSNNKIHTLNQDLFEHMSRIERLILRNNPLKMIDEHTMIALADIPYLSELDLSYTQLKELPEQLLHTPRKLRILNLSGNLFESVPKTLMYTESLEVLRFNGNPIKNFTHKIAFPHVKTLKKVFFCNMTELEEVGAHTFGNLPNLVELHICNNEKLSKIHASAFNRKTHDGHKAYPHINKLYIQNNNLTHIDRHLVANWDDVRDFDFSENPWACDCSNYWMVYNLTWISEIYNQNHKKYDDVPRIHHSKKFICASPEHLEGMSIYDLSNNRTYMDCAPTKYKSAHSFVLFGILSAMLFAVFGIGILVYLYKKQHISYAKLTNYTYRFKNSAPPTTQEDAS